MPNHCSYCCSGGPNSSLGTDDERALSGCGSFSIFAGRPMGEWGYSKLNVMGAADAAREGASGLKRGRSHALRSTAMP